MLRKILTLLSISCFLISCGNDYDNFQSREIVEFTDERQEVNLSEIAESVSFVSLETIDKGFIGQIRGALFTDSLTIVFDNLQKKIFVFNLDGDFKYAIDDIGPGPEEYSGITDFTINQKQNTIEVYSFHQGKIVGFDLENGNYKYYKDFNIYAREFAWLSEDKYLVFAPDLSNEDVNNTGIDPGIFLLSSNLELIEQIARSPKDEEYTHTMNSLSGHGEYAIIVSDFYNKIYEFENGKPLVNYGYKLPELTPRGEYAIPFSLSGTSEFSLISYGIPSGEVKSLLINKTTGEILDFISIKNDQFKFPVRPFFVRNNGILIDFLTYDTYSLIKSSMGEMKDSEFDYFSRELDSAFNLETSKFDSNSNPILIAIKLK